MVIKFILTRELGRLSRWLRILGFDSAYFNSANLSSLKIKALYENRIILTRNHWLENERYIKTILLESEDLIAQLKQIKKDLKLKIDKSSMFSRCIVCNTGLNSISSKEVKAKVPDYVYKTHNEFNICPCCLRIYWQGTHWGNVSKVIERIRG